MIFLFKWKNIFGQMEMKILLDTTNLLANR